MMKGKGVAIESYPAQDQEEEEGGLDYDHRNLEPRFALPFSTRNTSSRYDFVKVKVWLGESADHYYVLSRFLLSRMLTVTKIPNHVAIKIALELKKLLIDNSLLDVSQSDLEANLFKTDMVYELLRTATDAPLKSSPVWAREFSSPEELITEFCRECRIVRKGLGGDLKKAMKDGKPIIIESAGSGETISGADMVSGALKSMEIGGGKPVSKGEIVKDADMVETRKVKKEKSGPEPVIVPIILKMSQFDHKALLEEWLSSRSNEKYPIQDREKLIGNLKTIQDYLCSFKSQGHQVLSCTSDTKATLTISRICSCQCISYNFPQTLDWLHNYLLQRIEQGTSPVSPGSGGETVKNQAILYDGKTLISPKLENSSGPALEFFVGKEQGPNVFKWFEDFNCVIADQGTFLGKFQAQWAPFELDGAYL
ncbi:hypothetical protein Sango_2637500 [Sesamum angolense]|uniref:Uncharacterized protein n=1 Tax=Sesamum angolense TaxID=2727404 RepID=A0AAE1W1P9_9LAMI|nr:hypothetical protein Sango_2637500 [Sesamum angolense]